MSSIIHYRPNIPASVREDMLDGGPGEYKWGGRFFAVVREKHSIAVVELDGFDKPSAKGDAKPQGGGKGKEIGKYLMYGGAAGGTLALLGSFMSYGYTAQNFVALAAAGYVAAGVGLFLTKKA